MPDPGERSFSARLDCRYLVRAPDTIHSRTTLVAALHGFGQSAEIMLPLTDRLMGGRHVVAAIEGPYGFFLPSGSGAPGEVGYGWITSRRPADSIRLHHDMVRHVLDEAGREFGIPPERRLLVGFSQPVSLNYRFAATWPGEARGVIGLCGAVPSDWETGEYGRATAAVLHIARREDEFYPPEKTELYAKKLRLRIEDVEFHLLEGGHRFPSKGRSIVEGWLERILR